MSHIMSGVKIIEGIQEPEIANVSSRKSNPDAAFHHAPREKFEVLFNRLDIQVNQVFTLLLCYSLVAHIQVAAGH